MVRQSDRECVYFVVWPCGTFKIGWTGGGRYRAFLKRGGRLVAREDFEHWSAASKREDEAHEEARAKYPRAFKSAQDAIPYLGTAGSGWTECYRIDKLKEVPSG